MDIKEYIEKRLEELNQKSKNIQSQIDNYETEMFVNQKMIRELETIKNLCINEFKFHECTIECDEEHNCFNCIYENKSCEKEPCKICSESLDNNCYWRSKDEYK
jgi:hypothetical protein